MVADTRSWILQVFAAVMIVAALSLQASAVPITTGLSLQYDGTDVTTSGSEVLSWNNQGSLAAEGHVTPRLSTARPTVLTNSQNGHDVIDFAGQAQEVLRSGAFTTPIAQANTMFMVMRDNNGNSPVTFDGVQGIAGRNFFRPNGAGTFHLFAGASLTGGAGAIQNQYMVYSTQFDEANSTVHANGSLAYSVGASIGNQSLAAVALGNSDPNGSPAGLALTGQIAEVLFYDTPLNSSARLVTENYLSSKYNVGSSTVGSNVTLGLNDRYAGDLDTNGDYDRDVFGIGEDATSSLTLGDSAGLSIAESGGTLDSGEFVLAGHKTENNGLTSADMNKGNNRWERVWYLDTNGSSVDATVGFDWSDSGLVSPFDPAYGVLYYSPTDPFSFTALSSGTVVGDQIVFTLSAADLQTGYYTIGTAVPEPSSLILLGLCGLGLVRHRRRRNQS